uniref:GABA type A receptor associated protein like 2 n=1 Tax=Bos mutus grunniens TaxID=30521 RepID=A0A8B9YT93_BOSMU
MVNWKKTAGRLRQPEVPPAVYRSRRRRRCCCGWCAELRGSESRLRPFFAAAMKWMFKEDHSLEHRCVESAKIRAKYPDRVPVIVEKVSGSQIVDIDKRKYLVPSDITVAQFMWIIRKRIQLPSEKAIFLFVDKTVPQSREKKKILVVDIAKTRPQKLGRRIYIYIYRSLCSAALLPRLLSC